MTRVRRMVGVVVFASLVLAGCGGGDKKEATGTPVTQATTSPTTGEGTDGLDAITEASCVKAFGAMGQAATAFSNVFGGAGADFDESVDAFQAFANSAPKDIRSDLQKLAEGYAQVVAVLADLNYDPASGQLPSEDAMARLEAASAQFDESDFEAAGDRVEAWFANGCK